MRLDKGLDAFACFSRHPSPVLAGRLIAGLFIPVELTIIDVLRLGRRGERSRVVRRATALAPFMLSDVFRFYTFVEIWIVHDIQYYHK